MIASKKRIVIAGGSGFLGRHLEAALTERGYTVIILTRSPRQSNHVRWDGASLASWTQSINEAAAIIKLTGKSVDTRYTPANRREITESRVNSVSVMNEAILQCSSPPPVIVQASSLAIYGDAGDTILTDDSPPAEGFSPEVCIQWEKAFYKIELPATRKVTLRIGFALAKDGGALVPLANLTHLFLGGTVGSGHQYISWLHIEDLNRIFVESVENPSWEGIYNATGPNPVQNHEFMRTLRKVLKRPWAPPTPAFAAHIGAWFMQTEPQLALTGRRCIPERMQGQGFEFLHTNLEDTLNAIFHRS